MSDQDTLPDSIDLAISFASEDGEVAAAIATRLTARGYAVFHEDYEKAAVWGRDLPTTLSRVYGELSAFCLVIISRNYAVLGRKRHKRSRAPGTSFRG